jgi:hypothetical protein
MTRSGTITMSMRGPTCRVAYRGRSVKKIVARQPYLRCEAYKCRDLHQLSPLRFPPSSCDGYLPDICGSTRHWCRGYTPIP